MTSGFAIVVGGLLGVIIGLLAAIYIQLVQTHHAKK
jgi:ABC-type lipoprotein release transport system permease subunit